MDVILPATDNTVHLLTALDKQEGRHCLDVVCFRDVLLNNDMKGIT